MTELVIRITESEKQRFKDLVGEGNMSASLRQHIRSVTSSRTDKTDSKRKETILKRLSLLKPQYTKVNTEYNSLQLELEDIKAKERADEQTRLDEMDKQQQKMQDIKHDTMRKNLSEMI